MEIKYIRKNSDIDNIRKDLGSTNWAKKLNEDGYAKIEGVFTKAETETIKKEAYRTLELPFESGVELQKRGDHPILLLNPNYINPELKKFSHDKRMRDIVKYYLGPETLQLNNQIYFREPGDEDEFAWHQDIMFRFPKEDYYPAIQYNYLQTVIAVDDITEDNGAIEFIPGSHMQGDLDLIQPNELGLRKFVRGYRQGKKLTAKAGDLLLWNLLVIHGSERNKSKDQRMTFMSGFAAKSAVKTTKFKSYPW